MTKRLNHALVKTTTLWLVVLLAGGNLFASFPLAAAAEEIVPVETPVITESTLETVPTPIWPIEFASPTDSVPSEAPAETQASSEGVTPTETETGNEEISTVIGTTTSTSTTDLLTEEATSTSIDVPASTTIATSTDLSATTTVAMTFDPALAVNATSSDTTAPTQPNILSVATSGDQVSVTWSTSTDPVVAGQTTSGLRGYSFVWNHATSSTPNVETDPNGSSNIYTNTLAPGTWWFHIIAIDNATNTSAVSAYGPVVVNGASCPTTDRNATLQIHFASVANYGPSANMQAKTFLADGTEVANTADIPLVRNDQPIVDPSFNHDVPGLAVERGDGFIKFFFQGSHPDLSAELATGNLRLNGAYFTSLETPTGGDGLENQGDGFPTGDGSNGWSNGPGSSYNDEIYLNLATNRPVFFLSARENDDNFTLYYTVGCSSSTPIEPITGPTQPLITFSDHAVNATSTISTTTIVWSDSTGGTAPLKYFYGWDNSSTTIPENMASGTATTTTYTLSLGTWWFHVRAVDNVGSSSPTTHYGPVIIAATGTEAAFSIVNIRVTDVTGTSAIIHWQTVNPDATGHPANSRVIYDTVSHPDISGAAAPNYGYAFSTDTFDDNPKVVDHTVSITGLTPGTTYYFRVISKGSPEIVSGEFGGLSATTTPDEGNFTTPVTPPGGCVTNCGGGGGSYIVATTTATTTPACALYLKKFIRLGEANDPNEVFKLQAFLRVFEGRTDIPLSGVYDLATYNAVKDFQAKYLSDVLMPWGITDSTGYVYITTTLKINMLYCGLKDKIDLDLRHVYPEWAGGPAISTATTGEPAIDGGLIFGTTSTASSTATTTRGALQAALAGLVNYLGNSLCWLWIPILILLLLAYWWDKRRAGQTK